MAEPYLKCLTDIVSAIGPAKPRGVQLVCKHFFSGAALYANSAICASLTPVGFAVKLPAAARAAVLRERRGEPLRYFKDGPIKKDYVVLSATTIAEPFALRAFLEESVRHATRGRNIKS